MANQSTSSHIFSGLPLWVRFLELTKEQPAHQQMVVAHIDFALPLLDRFVDAFPKYTLHNRRHQYNIVGLMGQLLVDRLKDISGLEAAMLILSAVYHDIGMVFTTEELEKISGEADFKVFLEEHPEAKLQFEEADKNASESLVSWYCRWMHAKRVWPFLDAAENSTKHPLEWNGMPIKTQLGDICESHNFSVDFIRKNDQKFPVDFLGEADMMFCAILLRLADILDFDDTRTPKSVYEFLQLDQSQTGDDAVSDEEWQKHLSSRGFQFRNESGRVKLLYQAAPKNIKVEIGIRKFIKVIGNELDACNRLLRFCSERWRNFNLPVEINLEGLQSNGYRFGDYHFTLAEDKVMNLLTGDGIYNDEYVFLRELLQNALDTSRHREFRARSIDKEFKAQPIEVSHFSDAEGYRWIRVDDYGMGMNLDIIERHLLKKGESYYNSPLFKLEKLMIKDQQHTDFEPISRFGIGLLSCFMVGDRVEISTTHLDEPENAYRLSLESRDGYFMLKSKQERHPASPMPTPNGAQEGYRDKPGTSIAVRITTNKEYQGFDLSKRLTQYLLAPPVPVLYEGKTVGGDFDALLNKEWAEDQAFEMDRSFVDRVAELTGLSFSKGIQVKILTATLSKHALTTKLKGQILVIYVNAVPDAETPMQHESASFKLEAGEGALKLTFTKNFKDGEKKRSETATANLSAILGAIRVPVEITQERNYPHEEHRLGGMRISHNGIRIPENERSIQLDDYVINTAGPWRTSHHNGSYIATGIIYFQDELLPELTISRNEIKSLPFKIVAHLETAARQLEEIAAPLPLHTFDYFKEIDREMDDTRGAIAASRFYETNKAFWDAQIKVETLDGEFSVAELIAKIDKPTAYFRGHYRSGFYRSLVDYVLETNFDISTGVKQNGDNPPYWGNYINKKSLPLVAAADSFDPAIFTTFENENHLVRYQRNINRDHPYVQWYLAAYPVLKEKFNYYAKQLIYMLYNGLYQRERQYEQINVILDRLRTVLPEELRPPAGLKLTENDFNGKLGSSWNS